MGFFGNFEGGKNDGYDFTAIPRDTKEHMDESTMSLEEQKAGIEKTITELKANPKSDQSQINFLEVKKDRIQEQIDKKIN